MVGLVREAKGVNPKLRAVAALNAADAQGHDNDEAMSVLRDTENLEAMPTMLIRRKAYHNAAAQRRGVTDMNPKDPKPVEEMHALVRCLLAKPLAEAEPSAWAQVIPLGGNDAASGLRWQCDRYLREYCSSKTSPSFVSPWPKRSANSVYLLWRPRRLTRHGTI